MTVYTQGKIQVETLIIMARDSGTMNYPVIPFTIWTCVTLSGCDCKLALFQWEIFCFFFFPARDKASACIFFKLPYICHTCSNKENGKADLPGRMRLLLAEKQVRSL